MNLPKECSSPTFKNLMSKKILSPIELKEKMRKDYKNKVQKCRDMLVNRFREPTDNELKITLTDIYNKTFINEYEIQNDLITDVDENNILEEIKQELIQEELNWWFKEHEVSQYNEDWYTMQKDDSVICPICLKHNFVLKNNHLTCQFCNINIKTNISLLEIKKKINDMLELHSKTCNSNVQFTEIVEPSDTHIYYICEQCMDMQLLV